MKALITTPFLVLLSLFVISNQSTEENTLVPSFDEIVVQLSLLNCKEGKAVNQRQKFVPASNVIINVTDVPSDMSFLIIQVHTYQYNVTLSYDRLHLNKVSNSSLFGSNIGLFVIPKKTNPTQVFLRNDNVRTVEALLAVVPYTDKAPIPGGCNMEFDIEEAPYQKLVVNDAFVTVDLQPASPPPAEKTPRNCEKNYIQQDVYRVYLTEQDYSMESYFQAIANMLTPEDIIRNGEKISQPATSLPFRRIYSAYHGTGSVYAAIATYESRSAAYVPIFTYGCNYLLYPENCQLLNDTLSSIICGLVLFAGLLCVFLGHKCPAVELFAIKEIFCFVITYIIVTAFSPYDTKTNFGISIGGSIILVIVLCIFSACTSVDDGALVAVLSCGFLCSSIVYFSVKDSTGIEENNWIFWSIYLTIALLFMIILSVSSCFSVGPLTAVLSAFMVILPIDYFAGSSLKYIVINVIRRLTVPQFNYAIINPPIQSKDTSLIVFWILLAIIRLTNEFCGHIFCIFCRRNKACACVNLPASSETPLIGNQGYNARIVVFMKRRRCET